MRLLQRYLLTEFAPPFTFALIGLTLVLMLGNLVQLTDLVISKGVEIGQVARLFFYLVPYLLTFSLPMAVLVGTLLAFGRLSADNEITAMRASGVSLVRLFRPILTIGFLLSVLSVFLNDQVLPKAHFASRKLLAQIGVKNPTAYLEAGTFIRAFEGYILFIYDIHNHELFNVRIYQIQGDKPTRTLVAKRGEFIPIPEKNTVKLKLMDGLSDEPNPRDPTNIYKLNFQTYYLTLNLSQQIQKDRIQKKPKDMTLAELKQEIASLETAGVPAAPLRAEFHRKIALAFANFFLALIGFPLALLTHRGERSIGFALALGVFAVYYILLALGDALAIRGILSAPVATWLPNGLMGILGLLLIKKIVRV